MNEVVGSFAHTASKILSVSKQGELQIMAAGGGDMLCVTLQVWRRPKRRGQPVRGVWQTDLTLASSIDEAAIAQARRRRRPPPNLSVNQLAWAKDDSKAGIPSSCTPTRNSRVFEFGDTHECLGQTARRGEDGGKGRQKKGLVCRAHTTLEPHHVFFSHRCVASTSGISRLTN